MAKPAPFEIHVDPSCLSEDLKTENEMPAERVASNQTAVHHDTGRDEQIVHAQHTEEEHELNASLDDNAKQGEAARQRRIQRIQAAARAAADNIEKEHDFGNEDSVLSARTEETYDQEIFEFGDEEAEINYTEETEVTYESERDTHSHHNSEGAGDSSSHHDGDIDDDVFSSSNRSSARSSINSLNDLRDADDDQKMLTSPAAGEEASTNSENEMISRVPSGSSYVKPRVDNYRTPSKVLDRPPFRTPSSVRAMQMTSPTPPLYTSPRSAKRYISTNSRLGTPTSNSSPSKRTPTRFKIKKEYPLVLLHVTVMPLQWPYSHAMASQDLPDCLQDIKESWKLLQNKIGDTVLERGVLLAHPQESYEILEERLLEALELPVRPRAKILKCGHYMGPMDSDAASSDDELGTSWAIEKREVRDWCDICRRNIRLEDIDEIGGPDIKFGIKIYASNGLMKAGAWAAVWREMERVDVEIEPLVDANLLAELEHLASITPVEQPTFSQQHQEEDDGFVDEDMMIEDVPREEQQVSLQQETHEEEVRMREEEVRSRIAEEEAMRQKMADDDRLRQLRIVEEEEMKQRFEAEERLKISQMAEELGIRQRMHREDDLRRSLVEVERRRDSYSRATSSPLRHHTPRESISSRSNPEYFDIPTATTPNHQEDYETPRQRQQRHVVRGDESLSELLVAAFKVAIQDSKNIAIVFLSAFVLLLALRSSSPAHTAVPIVKTDPPPLAHITTTVVTEIVIATSTITPEAIVSETFVAPEPSVVIVTETLKAPQATTTVFQERTVTQMIPAPSETLIVAAKVFDAEEEAVEMVSGIPDIKAKLDIQEPIVSSGEEIESEPILVNTVEEIVPEKIVQEEIMSEEIVPKEIMPQDLIVEESVLQEFMPEEIAPEEIAPKEIVPKEIVPEEIVNEDSAPEQISLEESVHHEIVPQEDSILADADESSTSKQSPETVKAKIEEPEHTPLTEL